RRGGSWSDQHRLDEILGIDAPMYAAHPGEAVDRALVLVDIAAQSGDGDAPRAPGAHGLLVIRSNDRRLGDLGKGLAEILARGTKRGPARDEPDCADVVEAERAEDPDVRLVDLGLAAAAHRQTSRRSVTVQDDVS